MLCGRGWWCAAGRCVRAPAFARWLGLSVPTVTVVSLVGMPDVVAASALVAMFAVVAWFDHRDTADAAAGGRKAASPDMSERCGR